MKSRINVLKRILVNLVSVSFAVSVAITGVVSQQAEAVVLNLHKVATEGPLITHYRNYDKIAIQTGDYNDCKYVNLDLVHQKVFECPNPENFNIQLISSTSGKTLDLETSFAKAVYHMTRTWGDYYSITQTGTVVDPDLGELSFTITHYRLTKTPNKREGTLSLKIGNTTHHFAFVTHVKAQ